MRKHFGVGWGYWSTMTQNGTRMHKLRPLKPKFSGEGLPESQYLLSQYLLLGVILQIFMPPTWVPCCMFFRTKPFLIPEYLLHYVNNDFGRVYIHKNCGVHSPVKSPNVTYFRQSDLKNTKKKRPKIGQKWPKILWPKMGFPTGRPEHDLFHLLDYWSCNHWFIIK